MSYHISFCKIYLGISEEILRGSLVHFFNKKYTVLCSALPTHFDCILFLAKQSLRMFSQRMSG